jgi:uncharacterized protein YejL (UPF0352 family)
MDGSGVVNVMGAIVFVALVTTIVAHPNTSAVIKSFGEAFTNSLKAAEGGASTK